MTAALDPLAPVVFTRHAEHRLAQRAAGVAVWQAESELRQALCETAAVERRWRNIWHVHAADHTFVVARRHDGRLLVITVELAAVAA